MIAQVENNWITLTDKKNGLTVQRCFNSINPIVGKPNEQGKSDVLQCIINFYQQELYPTGEVCKETIKTYCLENLAETDVTDTTYMAQLNVLDGFIASIGQNYIVNAVNETLANTDILPIDAPNNYPLHLNTRPIIKK